MADRNRHSMIATRAPSGSKSKARKGPDPTHQQWEDAKGVIEQLFLTECFTLPTVRKMMENQYHFVASDRMYKTRLKHWGFVKKTTSQEYNAMNIVLNHRKAHGLDTAFNVPHGHQRRMRYEKDIRKESQRSTSRSENMSVTDAYEILKQSDIKISIPPPKTTPKRARYSRRTEDQKEAEARDEDSFEDEKSYSSSSPEAWMPATPRRLPSPCIEQLGLLANNMHKLDDITSSFASLTFDATFGDETIQRWSAAFADGGTSDHTLVLDNHQSAALKWATPFLLSSFSDNRPGTADVLKQWKQDATKNLRGVLKDDPDNRYILRYLNWMSTTLYPAGEHQQQQLGDFHRDSCAVVDEKPGMKDSFGATFHYAMAIHFDNAPDIARYGAKLEKLCQPMKVVFGSDHPNVLVSQYYWAWHLLDQGHYDQALEILLHQCLPVLERSFGARDLLTINCLVILARAQGASGNLSAAIENVQRALSGLEGCPPILEAFRLIVLRRLVEYQTKAGDTRTAEQHIRELLELRIQRLGWDHPWTWTSIKELCELVAINRGTDEAQRIQQDIEEERVRHYERLWHEERGYSIPMELQSNRLFLRQH